MKNTNPRIAAIPPDRVLITVTTETDPAIAPHENAENPPRFIRLALVSVAQFFSGGNAVLVQAAALKDGIQQHFILGFAVCAQCFHLLFGGHASKIDFDEPLELFIVAFLA